MFICPKIIERYLSQLKRVKLCLLVENHQLKQRRLSYVKPVWPVTIPLIPPPLDEDFSRGTSANLKESRRNIFMITIVQSEKELPYRHDFTSSCYYATNPPCSPKTAGFCQYLAAKVGWKGNSFPNCIKSSTSRLIRAVCFWGVLNISWHNVDLCQNPNVCGPFRCKLMSTYFAEMQFVVLYKVVLIFNCDEIKLKSHGDHRNI